MDLKFLEWIIGAIVLYLSRIKIITIKYTRQREGTNKRERERCAKGGGDSVRDAGPGRNREWHEFLELSSAHLLASRHHRLTFFFSQYSFLSFGSLFKAIQIGHGLNRNLIAAIARDTAARRGIMRWRKQKTETKTNTTYKKALSFVEQHMWCLMELCEWALYELRECN